MILGAVALGLGTVAGVMADILQVRLPYPGMFGVAVGIVVIALQFARADRRRDEQLSASHRRFRAIFDQTFQFIGLWPLTAPCWRSTRPRCASRACGPKM